MIDLPPRHLGPPTDGPRWLTVAGASRYCGLSPDTIRRLLARRDLRQYRVCRRLLIDRRQLDEFIQENQVP